MQTTRGASLSGEGDRRGTSREPSATQQYSGEGDRRGTSREPSATQQYSAPQQYGGEGEHAINVPSRRRHVRILIGVAVVVLALDVISKLLVVAKLSDREPVRLLGGFLKLEETRNAGAAFSIGTGATFLFAVVAIGVIVVIVRSARRLYSRPWAVVLGLLLGGATGNLIDRLVRAPGVFRGEVVDWIRLPHFAVFNLADSAITIGGVLAVLLALRGHQMDGSTIAVGSALHGRDAAERDAAGDELVDDDQLDDRLR